MVTGKITEVDERKFLTVELDSSENNITGSHKKSPTLQEIRTSKRVKDLHVGMNNVSLNYCIC